MKTCPYCAEEIQDAAIKCKHCGSLLSCQHCGSKVTSEHGTPAYCTHCGSPLTIQPSGPASTQKQEEPADQIARGLRRKEFQDTQITMMYGGVWVVAGVCGLMSFVIAPGVRWFHWVAFLVPLLWGYGWITKKYY